MKIAVTGGMGTGKSTLVAWLKAHLPGYEFFSVDDLVAELYANPVFTAALLERFGVAERKAVSQLVFADKAARVWLEALSTQLLQNQLAGIFARPRIVVEFPLLMEMVAPYVHFDVRIATWCDPELQHSRIAERDGTDNEHTARKLAAQMSAQFKASLADIVVDMTDGPDGHVLEALEAAQQRVTLKERCAAFFGSTTVWPVLSALYGSPERVAHGLEYLSQVLARMDAHREHAANPKALELAVWFHAAGLSLLPGQYADSPSRSVRLMWQVLSDTAPAWFDDLENLPLASEMISSLQHQRIDSSRVEGNPAWLQDTALFLDIMMLAYVATGEALDKHWADTCAELQAMPWMQDNLPQLLAHLADRPRLLLTDTLHGTLESRVREGMTYLLAMAGAAEVANGLDEGFESGLQFNAELHAMQDKVYSGEAFGDAEPRPSTAGDVQLPAWPADTRTTPYEE